MIFDMEPLSGTKNIVVEMSCLKELGIINIVYLIFLVLTALSLPIITFGNYYRLF